MWCSAWCTACVYMLYTSACTFRNTYEPLCGQFAARACSGCIGVPRHNVRRVAATLYKMNIESEVFLLLNYHQRPPHTKRFCDSTIHLLTMQPHAQYVLGPCQMLARSAARVSLAVSRSYRCQVSSQRAGVGMCVLGVFWGQHL